MRLVLTYELPDYSKRQLQLLANQRVTVGSTDEAEHPIYRAVEMEGVQFQLVTSDDDCWLVNLASDFTATEVNGVQVRETRLYDGDQIRAGGLLFHVTLSAIPGRDAPPAAPLVPPPHLPVKSYRYHPGRCGLHRYQDNGDELRAEQVIRALQSQNLNWYLLANFKAARMELPGDLSPEADLYQYAPAEICQQHSLHLVADPEVGRLHDLFQELSLRDAAVGILTDHSPRDLLRLQRLYLAWFARPSLLEFHLAQASEHLVEKLTANLHGVLTHDHRRKDSWALTVNSRLIPDWRGLGFEFPPVSG